MDRPQGGTNVSAGPSGPGEATPAGWSAAADALTAWNAYKALVEASRLTGLDVTGAALLGPVADNAVFRLPSARVVARVAAKTALPRVERELRIARWLANRGFPAVRVADDIAQPVLLAGWVVTFWIEIIGPVQATTSEMGTQLRRLHDLDLPDEFDLEVTDPLAGVDTHIASSTGISSAEREFLAERAGQLRHAYDGLVFTAPHGPVHGDAHRKNILRDINGQVLLLDLERFGAGPREWDLTVPAVYRRLGWYDSSEYCAFVDTYGWDVTRWEGFPVLAAIRELGMTTWLTARTGREPRLLDEARRRISSLRDDTAPRTWSPGT